jgi:hypothetical protein
MKERGDGRPRHPEQKKTLWIEDNIYNVMYAQVYDKKGNLWKGQILGVLNIVTAQGKPGWTVGAHSCTDLKNNYWSMTFLDIVTADGPMDSSRFNPAALVR